MYEMASRAGETNEDIGPGERRPHKGWQARERAANGSARVPLRERETPASNRDEVAELRNGTLSSFRPFEIPPLASEASNESNAASALDTTAASPSGKIFTAIDDKEIILRCMYTNQKVKKRKTWSDGAVRCCPKRQRVSLYRWSEALGVTEKLLGEIYLSMPEYEAFITQAEPELEMELYIVSLDGVVQPADNTSGGVTSSKDALAESAVAGFAAGGTAGAGKKRKLFKAFKPPARRAAPPAPSSDGSWGLPPWRMGQLRNGDRSSDQQFFSDGEGKGADNSGTLAPRMTYTGFGHVESLWDDDHKEAKDCLEDLAGMAGLAGEDSSVGWGMARAGPGYRGTYDGGNVAGVFPEHRPTEAAHPHQREQLSATASAEGGMNDWIWGLMRGGHNTCSSSTPPRSNVGFHDERPLAVEFAGQQGRPHNDEPLASRQNGPSSSYPEDGEKRIGRARQSSASRSAQRGNGHAEGQRYSYPENQRYDCDGSVVGGASRVEGEPLMGAFVPGVDQEPADGGVGGGMEMRSTQDILSIFGGFGGSSSAAGGNSSGSQTPASRQRETVATLLLQSSEPNEVPVRPEASRGALMPVRDGIPRAADMGRVQREARAESGLAKPRGGVAGTVTNAGAASVTSAAGDTILSDFWNCGTCGVRGGASSTSCRVCGAKRQVPRNDGDVGLGSESGFNCARGDLGDVDSGNQRGWGGDDLNGGGGWHDQELDGAADAEDIEIGAGTHDDSTPRVVDAEGISYEGKYFVGRGCRSSSSRLASPQTGDQGEIALGSCTLEASSNRRTVSARMQMDVGFSSDSDDA